MRSELQQWLGFLRANAHVLRDSPELSFQQVANYSGDSEPTKAAERLWNSGQIKRPWIKKINNVPVRSLMTIVAHERSVIGGGFLSDEWIVSCGKDGANRAELKVWDFRTGAERGSYAVGDNPKLTLFSRDASRFGIVDSSGTKIFDTKQVKELASLPYEVDAIAFANVNTAFALARRNEILIAKNYSGTETSRIALNSTTISGLTFSPDDGMLAAGAVDGTVTIHDLTNKTTPVAFTHHEGAIKSIEFSHDRKFLASASEDHTVVICKANSGEKVAVLESQQGQPRNAIYPNWAGFSLDDAWLVTVSEGTSVRFWSTETWTEVEKLNEHTSSVFWAAFANDVKHVVTGSADGTLRIWELPAALEKAHAVSWPGESVHKCELSLHGKRFVSNTLYGETRVVDANTGRELKVFEGTDKIAERRIAISNDGRLIALQNADETVLIYDVAQMKTVSILPDHRAVSYFFSPDNQTLLTASSILDDNSFRSWDVATGRQQSEFPTKHFSDVVAGSYSPDGKKFISCGTTLQVWESVNLRTIEKKSIDAKQICFSAGGELFAVKVWNELVVFETAQLREKLRVSMDRLSCFSLSPEGNLLAAGSLNKIIRVWDTRNGVLLTTLHGHLDRVLACGFKDEQSLISVSADSTIRTWSLAAEPAPTKALPLTKLGPIDSCSFSPNGRRVAWLPTRSVVTLCDTETGAEHGVLHTRVNACSRYEFFPDNSRVVCAVAGGRILLHDPESTEISTEINVKADEFFSVVTSPDSGLIITGPWIRGKEMYGTAFFKTGQEIGPIKVQGALSDAAWTLDARFVLTKSMRNEIRNPLTQFGVVHDFPLEISFFQQARPTRTPFTADGKRLIGVSHDSSVGKGIHVMSVETGREESYWPVEERITTWALSPCARHLITGSRESKMSLWDVVSGNALWQVHTAFPILSVDFFADGRFILSAGVNRFHVWDLNGKLVAKFVAAAPLTSVACAPAELTFAGGTRLADLYLLKACGLDASPPRATLRRMFRYRYVGFELLGSWDSDLGLRCPWCAHWFTPENAVVDVVRAAEAVSDKYKDTECKFCHNVVRLNPFIIDNRDAVELRSAI